MFSSSLLILTAVLPFFSPVNARPSQFHSGLIVRRNGNYTNGDDSQSQLQSQLQSKLPVASASDARPAPYPGRCGYGAPFDDPGCVCPSQPTEYRKEIFCGYVSKDWFNRGAVAITTPKKRDLALPFGDTIRPIVYSSTNPLARAIHAIGPKMLVENTTAIILNGANDTLGLQVQGISGVVAEDLTFAEVKFPSGAAWVIRWDFSWYRKDDDGKDILPVSGILGPNVRLLLEQSPEIRVDMAYYYMEDSMFRTADHLGDYYFEKVLAPMSKVAGYQGVDKGFDASMDKPELLLAADWQKSYNGIPQGQKDILLRDEGWSP